MFIRESHMSSKLFLLVLISINFPSLILSLEKAHGNHRGGIISTRTNERTIGPIQTCPVFLVPLPKGKSISIPQIQHQFDRETQSDRCERAKRQRAVRNAFQHSWNGYKTHAWLRDELTPISGGYKSSLGGWAATLIDSLDTLLIMGLDEEFKAALEAVHYVDFSTPKIATVNVFETTIRHLGGLISAYDLTEGKRPILFEKAQELGELLYGAFDTPNRMPEMRWQWIRYAIIVLSTPGKGLLHSCINFGTHYPLLGAYLNVQHSPVNILCLPR